VADPQPAPPRPDFDRNQLGGRNRKHISAPDSLLVRGAVFALTEEKLCGWAGRISAATWLCVLLRNGPMRGWTAGQGSVQPWGALPYPIEIRALQCCGTYKTQLCWSARARPSAFRLSGKRAVLDSGRGADHPFLPTPGSDLAKC